MNAQQYAFIHQFHCLGEKCPDTCCYGWDMQLDNARHSLYTQNAPDLLEAITPVSGTEHGFIMKRDPQTDYCLQFCSGLCRIHKEHGSDFLGDACHFYPRITRKIGSRTLMSAALSCPETVRLVLYGADPFTLVETHTERLPLSLKQYLPEGLAEEKAAQLLSLFLHYPENTAFSPEHIILHLYSLARSLEAIPEKDWLEAAECFLPGIDERLIPASTDLLDPYRLLNNLVLLMKAAGKIHRPALQAITRSIAEKLDSTIDWSQGEIVCNSTDYSAYSTLAARWQSSAAHALDAVLRRWIQGQIAASLFPFSGFGNTPLERAYLLCIRFATLKLALMSAISDDGALPSESTVIHITGTLSRLLDHLASPELSLILYNDAGWGTESRLRGLIEI